MSFFCPTHSSYSSIRSEKRKRIKGEQHSEINREGAIYLEREKDSLITANPLILNSIWKQESGLRSQSRQSLCQFLSKIFPDDLVARVLVHMSITSLLKNGKVWFFVRFKPSLIIIYKFIFPKVFLPDYIPFYIIVDISKMIFIFLLIALLSTFQKNTNNQSSHFISACLFFQRRWKGNMAWLHLNLFLPGKKVLYKSLYFLI